MRPRRQSVSQQHGLRRLPPTWHATRCHPHPCLRKLRGGTLGGGARWAAAIAGRRASAAWPVASGIGRVPRWGPSARRPVAAALAGPLSGGRRSHAGRTLRRPARRPCPGWARRGWPVPRRGWRRRPEPGRSPVVPLGAARIPRSAAIVGAPVRADRKGDHGRAAAHRPRQVSGVDPAPPPARDDVAPAPAAGAADHVHRRSRPQPRDQRKRAVRARTHVDRLRRERRLREGGHRQQQQ